MDLEREEKVKQENMDAAARLSDHPPSDATASKTSVKVEDNPPDTVSGASVANPQSSGSIKTEAPELAAVDDVTPAPAAELEPAAAAPAVLQGQGAGAGAGTGALPSHASSPPSSRIPSPDGRANEISESSSGSEEILPDRARALPLEKVDVGADFHDDDKPDGLAHHHLHTDPLELDEPVVEERKERSTRLRRTVTRQPTHSEDSYDDYSSSEEEEMRKTIMIGSAYQAVVPEGFSKYGESKPYKYADKLLWDPKGMQNEEVEQYLQSSHQITDGAAEGIDMLPMGSHTRDDEQALFVLMQCNYNAEEALKKRCATPPPPPPPSPSSHWTEEECRNFENGLLTYGKDFHTIQAQKVRTRSVSEIVQFYYLWKKTERHDIFANKMRPDKKKYMLHPGVTLVVYELLEKENQKESVSKDPLTA